MRALRKLSRSRFAAFLLISGLVFALVMGLRSSGSLESLELTAYDWFIRLRPDTSGPDPRIALVTISEADIRQQGQWPLTDAVLARVLSILTRHEPCAIGLDLFRDIPVPPGQEDLDSVLRGNNRIIGAMKFGVSGVPPHPALAGTERFGFNDILVDPGGIVRRGILFMDDGKTIFYSFAFRLALLYLQSQGIAPQPDPIQPQHIRLGKKTIHPFGPSDGGYVQADARGYQFLLDFKGYKKGFKSYSLTDVLSGKIGEKVMEGKIVLVGVLAQSVKDFFYTPLSRGFIAGQQISGVELHAHAASQLLSVALDGNAPMRTPTERSEVFWILLWVIMGGVMGMWVRSPWRFAMWGACGLLIIGIAGYLALVNSLWIPSVPPGMGMLASAAVVTAYVSNREKSERALLMQLFSKHVSKEIAEEIWQQRDQFLEGGRPRSQKLFITVLFSDLRGFTSLSERMDPQELIDWLNTYMESMTKMVMDHGGVIDDYAGDGIKANFGVPLPRTSEEEIRRDATNAVNCALAMEKEMVRLNVLWQKKDLPAVGMRIGIFSGPAVAGLLGSSERLKYTTVGDTVNTAARLESYDKDLAKDALCRILVGESSLRYLGRRFKTQKVGEVTLKGKGDKITIHRVLGLEGLDPDNHYEEVMI